MLLLAPYQVNTLFQRNPWANLAIIVATVGAWLATALGGLPESTFDAMVLEEWSPAGLVGHLFLHGGLTHFIGNMLFLFVFGNAVCGVMNSWLYTACYFGTGLAAAAMHNFFDGDPAIGASGAVSGIVGLYVAIYPTNYIRCVWFFLVRGGLTEFSGWVVVLFWFLLDLYGAVKGTEGVAYFAHLGGILTGFVLGLWLLSRGWIDLFDYDHPTLPQLYESWRGESEAS